MLEPGAQLAATWLSTQTRKENDYLKYPPKKQCIACLLGVFSGCKDWMDVGYWLPAPDPQLGESWPLEQVHMFGLEQKPSPHEFLQIAVGRQSRSNPRPQPYMANRRWHRAIPHIPHSKKSHLRTMHWFPPGRVFQPGQQYEWKRDPHTLGL